MSKKSQGFKGLNLQSGSFSGRSSSEYHNREKYEAHIHLFSDWVRRFGLERTLFGRIFLVLGERYNFQRIIYVLIFSVLLSFAITFDGRTYVNYKVGDIAASDVISPSSFEIIDTVTTEEKKVKAEMVVPIIFDYDPYLFEKVSGQVYRAFRLMRMESKNIKWPQNQADIEEKEKEFFSFQKDFQKELGLKVPDYLFEWLIQSRFSARIENVVLKNLESWYERKIADNFDRFIPQNKTTVLARIVQKNNRGREFSLNRSEIIDVPNLESLEIKIPAGSTSFSPKDISNIKIFTRLLVLPNLTLNKQEMESRRQYARDGVIPVTVSVKKNQTIISEGTLIQPFHTNVLKKIQELSSHRRQDITIIAMTLAFCVMIVIFFQYLRRFTLSRVRVENKDIAVMGLVTLLMVFVAKTFLFITEAALTSKFGSQIPLSLFLYATPVAAGPMMVGLLILSGEVVWLFVAFMAIVMGLMTESNFIFMVVSFAGGIAGARGVYGCKKRNDIYWAGVRTGAVNSFMIALLLTILRYDQEGFSKEILCGVPAGFLGGIFSSLITMMFIPFLESLFNYTTDIKLLELSNLNHPLLKEMIVKAPGTYHHSMLVGSMVEAASEEIGANPLLSKVMAYYHDIGKMEHANYFIENQKPGNNPHDHISPYMSKTLLIAHVKDGVELGLKFHLGKPIIDGIIQHHGTTLISYFYNKAIDLEHEAQNTVSEEEFRYPGPKPQFREAALIMLADSIEAAARSLDEPTPVRLQNIVKNITQRKFMEGQLDECGLTLKDLSKVELAFVRILLGIYHQRIDYPRAAGGGASMAPISLELALEQQHLGGGGGSNGANSNNSTNGAGNNGSTAMTSDSIDSTELLPKALSSESPSSTFNETIDKSSSKKI